jgi:hypothetical protein
VWRVVWVTQGGWIEFEMGQRNLKRLMGKLKRFLSDIKNPPGNGNNAFTV